MDDERRMPADRCPPAARTDTMRLPRPIVWTVAAVCLLPQLLIMLGVELGLPKAPPGADEASRGALSGMLVHTVLEWSAFAVAVGVALLAFSHYIAMGDATTPVLGMALLCSGTMDAFHVLAFEQLLPMRASSDLIPFTWSLSRLFNALILTVGVGFCLIRLDKPPLFGDRAPTLVLALSVTFALLAGSLIALSATSESLPRTMYPEALVTRPWDVAPLILFVVSGLFVFPRFHRARPSLFSHALLLSVVPAVVTQLHMAFGSTTLYDAHFNAAHALKVLAYAVPLVGLVLDYGRTHRELVDKTAEVEQAQESQRRSELPFRRLYDANIIGIILADIRGNITDANDAFLEMVGYDRSELPLNWVDLTPPEWLPRDEAAIGEFLEKGAVPVWEKEYLRKDGTRVPILLAVAMLDRDEGTCICPILDLSERSRLEKAVLEQSEKERRRLGWELHDGLGQHLTGLAFQTKALETRLEQRNVPESQQAARIRSLAEQAVGMARDLAQLVSPADLQPDGLGPALARLAVKIGSLYDVHCELEQDEQVAVRDDTTATNLFHIAQEAMTNAVKHGKARNITVSVRVTDGQLLLQVTDNGDGMPAERSNTGMGLGIMQHRARLIGAHLEHRQRADGGTIVACSLPISVTIG